MHGSSVVDHLRFVRHDTRIFADGIESGVDELFDGVRNVDGTTAVGFTF